MKIESKYMVQNNFLRISLAYWITVSVTLANLLLNDQYKDAFTMEQKVVFSLACLLIYIIVSAVFFIFKKLRTPIEDVMPTEIEVTYFESKIQYYVITISVSVMLAILYFTNIGGMADLIIYLLCISIIAFIFVVLYPISSITLTQSGFQYRKGLKSFSAEWGDIKGIHANPEPSTFALAFYSGSSVSFLIETTRGVTGYIDSTTVKIRNHYSPFVSSGNMLVKELMNHSKVSLTTGTYSELNNLESGKLNSGIVIILLIVIVVSFYFATRI